MRGKLIVFEGVEGCGKTTQLQRSREWLCDSKWMERLRAAGYAAEIVLTREPGGTDLGRGLRHLLLERHGELIVDRAELLLYAADRAQHVEEVLKPQLSNGAIILCDRYIDSTVAYQGYGRGINLTLINQLNEIATGGLESDLTLWLDVDAERGLARAKQRGAADRMEQAELAFHQRVEHGFRQVFQQNLHRIVRVEASGSEVEVHSAIQAVLQERLSWWC